MRKWLAAILVAMLMLSFTAAASASGPARSITVVFKDATLPADAAALVAKHGGTVVYTVPEVGTLVANGPLSMIDQLSADPAVLAASPTLPLRLEAAEPHPGPDLTGIDTSRAWVYQYYGWDIKQVTNDGASWEINPGSHNTVVGIIDTGVDADHPDLVANFMGGRNVVPDGPNGTIDPADIEDTDYHGTHVAGTIAGHGAMLGVAPNIGFRAYRAFGHDRSGSWPWLASALVAAADDGVDVIQLSAGGLVSVSGYTYTDPATGEVMELKEVADYLAVKHAIQYAVNHGVVVVTAAGNDGINITNPTVATAMFNQMFGPYGYEFRGATQATPATLPGVVTVSATRRDKSLAPYSNYGPGAIDVTAPGGDSWRYPADGWWDEMCLSTSLYGTYGWMDGTSASTPKASAVAALIVDQAKAQGERLTPAQVVAKLKQSATRLGNPGYDQFFGWGMVNAYTALGGQ